MDPFYRSREWRTLRAAFLRANPACIVPGCRFPATHADHRVTRRAGGPALDQRNLDAYCQRHHNQKTARLDHPDWKSNNAPLRAIGFDVNGWPLDPTRR